MSQQWAHVAVGHVEVSHMAVVQRGSGATWQWDPPSSAWWVPFFSKLCLFGNRIKLLHKLLPFLAKATPKILTAQNRCHCTFSACCNNLWASGNVFVMLLKAIYGVVIIG